MPKDNDLISRSELWKKFDEAHLFDDGSPRHIAQQIVEEAPDVVAVVLPCKVGDTVYRKDGLWDVVGFDCNRGGGWKVKLERWKDQFRDYHESTRVSFSSFGKTVFLTREEAEAVLAERMKKDA